MRDRNDYNLKFLKEMKNISRIVDMLLFKKENSDVTDENYTMTNELRNFIVNDAKKYPRLYECTPLNIKLGKIYTDEEFRKRSDKILKKKLPGGNNERRNKKTY